MFEIIQATWHDLKELRQLERVCFESDAWPLIDLIAVLTFPGTMRIKASVKGAMVGFIAGEPRHHEGAGWVTTLGVLPEHRHQGIARALLSACEEQMEMPVVRLCVRRSNFGAQRLYLKAGYHQASVWERYYSGREDAIVYEKRR